MNSEITYAVYPDPDPIPGEIGLLTDEPVGTSYEDTIALVARHVLEKTNEPFSAMETVSLVGGHSLERTITAEQNVEQIYDLKADLVLADADAEPPVVEEEPTAKRRVYPAQLVIIPGKEDEEDEVVEALEPPKPKEIRLSRSQRKKQALAKSRIPVDIQVEIKAKADAFVEKQAKVEQSLDRLTDKILLAQIKQEEEEEEDLAIWLLL